MFPVYSGKCFSCKAVHIWVEKRDERFADDQQVKMNGDAELAETTVKRLLCCEFRRTDKAKGQAYQCWWICREINVFFAGSNITCVMLFINLLSIY
jgi:hypothetical protein